MLLVYRVPGRTLMFEGSMLLALGTITICVAASMPRLILIMLTQSLYPLFLLEAVAGGTAMALISTVRADSVERRLVREVSVYGPQNHRLSAALDKLQRQNRCCGALGPGDWKGHPPSSCCGSGAEKGCTEKCAPDDPTISVKGCAETLNPLLVSHLHSVIMCAFVCLFLHHSMFMVAMHLDRNL